AKAEPLEHPWPKVLEHDIGDSDETLQSRRFLRVLEVDGNGTFVAIDRREVFAERGAIAGAREGRPAAQSIATLRILYLHHIGAEVCQEGAGERPSCDLAELKHAHSGERALGSHAVLSPLIVRLASAEAAHDGRQGRTPFQSSRLMLQTASNIGPDGA